MTAAQITHVLDPATTAPDTLVVAFASAQAAGEPPHFRYRGVLSELACHRLFVLDDHGLPGPPPGPSWYLGPSGSGVADSVCALIERVAGELDIARTVSVGSSMGGWAALYFGARVGAGHAIAGEPQTRLGDYLCGPAFHRIAEHVAGGSSPTERALLDGLLFDTLRAAPSRPRMHLYCARNSPHHVNHVLPLVEAFGADCELELGDFGEHADVGPPFSEYLLRCLSGLTGDA
jgi:pimeloyl-ACP methyl ester carboxylesterase